MGKSLILRSPEEVIPSLPEFEKVDGQGQKIYSEMVIKYYTFIPGEIDHYVAPIIQRSSKTKADCVLDAILDVYHKNPLITQIEELYRPEFIEEIKRKKRYMFDEDKRIPVRICESTLYEVVGVELYLR